MPLAPRALGEKTMGDYLGRVSNFVLGNTNGRFLGRRMHRSSFQDMRAQLASPGAWSNPLDRAREMSTWAYCTIMGEQRTLSVIRRRIRDPQIIRD